MAASGFVAVARLLSHLSTIFHGLELTMKVLERCSKPSSPPSPTDDHRLPTPTIVTEVMCGWARGRRGRAGVQSLSTNGSWLQSETTHVDGHHLRAGCCLMDSPPPSPTDNHRPPTPTIIAEVMCGEQRREAFVTCVCIAGLLTGWVRGRWGRAGVQSLSTNGSWLQSEALCVEGCPPLLSLRRQCVASGGGKLLAPTFTLLGHKSVWLASPGAPLWATVITCGVCQAMQGEDRARVLTCRDLVALRDNSSMHFTRAGTVAVRTTSVPLMSEGTTWYMVGTDLKVDERRRSPYMAYLFVAINQSLTLGEWHNDIVICNLSPHAGLSLACQWWHHVNLWPSLRVLPLGDLEVHSN
ncbi:hypothetical protein EI94DRAFT_1698105 [Lactarius quietus]|nr:hypothetical protein EI94DRAFT_1698105 [Lactarius quietus]